MLLTLVWSFSACHTLATRAPTGLLLLKIYYKSHKNLNKDWEIWLMLNYMVPLIWLMNKSLYSSPCLRNTTSTMVLSKTRCLISPLLLDVSSSHSSSIKAIILQRTMRLAYWRMLGPKFKAWYIGVSNKFLNCLTTRLLVREDSMFWQPVWSFFTPNRIPYYPSQWPLLTSGILVVKNFWTNLSNLKNLSCSWSTNNLQAI